MRSAAFFRFWADEGERFSPRRKLGFVDQAIGELGNRQQALGNRRRGSDRAFPPRGEGGIRRLTEAG